MMRKTNGLFQGGCTSLVVFGGKLPAALAGALLVALVGALLPGCSKSDPDAVNSSQTHWLKRCSSDGDCGDLSCLCGVCTQSCDTTGACSGLADNATCARVQSGGDCADEPARVCLAGCEDDDQCGSEARCEDDACVPVEPADDDTSDDDTMDDDSSGDDVSDDDTADDDTADDDVEDPPPGVRCADYVPCDLETPCEGGLDCLSLDDCDGAICIATAEACSLSCPVSSECLILDSAPAQLACHDEVPGSGEPDGGTIPADPPGVSCDEYLACGIGAEQCAPGVNCIAIVGCANAVCIPSAEACELSCPDPAECAIAESYPEQLMCPGRVPGNSGDSGSLRWFATCGDPSCGGYREKDGIDLCTDEMEGASCAEAMAVCDPVNDCNALLTCTDTDPTQQPGGCPRSRAEYKRDIRYVDELERQALASQILQTPLATYRYREAPERQHLGFIIEDVEPSASVDAERGLVDLYGYTSMAVAALQQQQQQMDELRREVEKLRGILAEAQTCKP